MIYSPNMEKSLLTILSKSDKIDGLFFVRWDEVKRHNYSTDYISSLDGAPNLNSLTEFHLNEMIKLGFVEDVERFSQDTGRSFIITKSGLEALERQTSFWKRAGSWIKKLRSHPFILVAFFILTTLYGVIGSLKPTKVCAFLPEFAQSWLVYCDYDNAITETKND